ncbi:MAG: C40 family peptidase [Vicinamibacterales bacterium]
MPSPPSVVEHPATPPALPRHEPERPGPSITTPDLVVQAALALRGAPYRNGGSGPDGFDCSGFTQYVFAQRGLRLPRETRKQFEQGTKVRLGEERPGDLIFFRTTSHGVSHVGIALGNDTFVHAPSSRGVVRVESMTLPYWRRRFVGIRRIVEE